MPFRCFILIEMLILCLHVVYDSILTGTDTIPFGTVSIIYVSDLLCDKNKVVGFA